MSFTDDQKQQLAAPLNRSNVKEREQGGRKLSYIEGWVVIDHANLIFGFDGWTRETIELKCVAEAPREIGQNKVPGHGVTYTARVRVTAGGITREGCGAGHGIDRDLGLAHESALKEAETDAMKRAFMTFGNPFGLALYDKQQSMVSNEPPPPSQAEIEARGRYIAGCEGTIEEMGKEPARLLLWWNSDAQKAQRRKYGLSAGEVELLKAKVRAKLPKEQTDASG